YALCLFQPSLGSEGVMESITYVSPRYPPYIGGVETHVSELTARASGRFRRVSVVTTDPSGGLPSTQTTGNGCTILRVRSCAPGGNYHFQLSASFDTLLRACGSASLHQQRIRSV